MVINNLITQSPWGEKLINNLIVQNLDSETVANYNIFNIVTNYILMELIFIRQKKNC